MLSKFLNVTYEHKKKLLFIGVLFGTYKLAQSSHFQKFALKWFQRKYMDRYEKEEVFKFIKQICADSMKQFQLNMFQKVHKIFQTDELEERYTHATSKHEKVELWDRLRLLVFCKITAMLYANVLFILGLTIHFSVTVAYQNADTNKKPEISGTHFSCILNFIENNLKTICDFIQMKITPIIEGTHLSSKFTYQNLGDLFYNIQTAMCIDPNNPMCHMGQYFYNNIAKETGGTDTRFYDMIEDAKYFLGTDEVISVANSLVSKSFHLLMVEITTDHVFNEMYIGLPLAHFVAKFNTRLTSKNYELVFLDSIPLDKKIETLSANVYEAFSN